MGWAGGSGLMREVIEVIRDYVPGDESRKGIYVRLIKAWKQFDCDTLTECFEDDPAFVEAYCVVDPREAGYQAARRGEPSDANPHEAGSREAADWREGWEEYTSYARDITED
jgi:hypothetical protein